VQSKRKGLVGCVQHYKDAMLGRFYAICNCCVCCCGALQARLRGTPLLASSGYVSRADPDLCTGCGLCVGFCPFGAVTLDKGYPAWTSWPAWVAASAYPSARRMPCRSCEIQPGVIRWRSANSLPAQRRPRKGQPAGEPFSPCCDRLRSGPASISWSRIRKRPAHTEG
jgi:ferredoxin